MTLGAAYAGFLEGSIGSLEVGKRADIVVMSRDIMSVEPNQILDARTTATIVDGQLVYGKL